MYTDSMMTFPPVCDYEGSNYRTRFWEGQGREYEDLSERVALRRLVPPCGSTLIEIGAGFGRLAEEYRGYEKVVLFDYSRSLLREAQARLGDDPRFVFVAGNWYDMPFVDGLFDAMVQVRTLHHAAAPAALFAQLARIVSPGGSYILEFANKRNIKAILRYTLRRQGWSPFSPEPFEFADLHFDFHPRWVREQLQSAGFRAGRTLTVSHFRVPVLKRIVPTRLLVALDALAQQTGSWWQFSPSVFIQSRHPGIGAAAAPGSFFACPSCATPLNETDSTALNCPGCGQRWGIENGLYDFKEPLAE